MTRTLILLWTAQWRSTGLHPITWRKTGLRIHRCNRTRITPVWCEVTGLHSVYPDCPEFSDLLDVADKTIGFFYGPKREIAAYL
jgi:hypothetical protein